MNFDVVAESGLGMSEGVVAEFELDDDGELSLGFCYLEDSGRPVMPSEDLPPHVLHELWIMAAERRAMLLEGKTRWQK